MTRDKILTMEKLNNINGGGIFGGEKSQKFQVGEVLTCSWFAGDAWISKTVTVEKCLGKNKNILYSYYRYLVRDNKTGESFITKQNTLSRS